MQIVGLVTEYNPFHNGHAYQLAQVQKQFGPNCLTVAVMSGNFTQRGEPACLDKWTRARVALKAGINLVIELPTLFAIAAAPDFADGAVRLLAATGLDLTICCGAETAQPDCLKKLARLSAAEPEALSQALQKALRQGLNPAAAWSEACRHYGKLSGQVFPEDLFTGSNNRLAMEYIKAADRLQPALPVHLLKRRQAPYLSQTLSDENAQPAWPGAGRPSRQELPASAPHQQDSPVPAWPPLASATAIRAKLKVAREEGDLPPASFWRHLPPTSAGYLLADLTKPEQDRLTATARAGQILYSRLSGLNPTDLQAYDGFSPDLARRLLKIVTGLDRQPPAQLWDDLIAQTRCKSFTEAMVSRALTALLLQVKKADRTAARQTGPLYLRPLACDRHGRRLLRQMRHTAQLPLISKNSDFLEHGQAGPDFRRQYELDLLAARTHSLLCGQPPQADFDMNTIIG